MKIKKKKYFFFLGGGAGGGRGGGGQGVCERRIEVFLENSPKKIGQGGGRGVFGLGVFGLWGVKVDVNEELKFL